MRPPSPSSSLETDLYAAHVPVFPRRVKGRYRTLKWAIMAVALGIYYVTPWLRWDRGAALPDQAVLIDLANRRFYFFMIEIWSHEFYFVAGLLIMAGLGLFLFTSAAGRVWCGYACPQTVWTDLFVLVERWVEGDRNARLRLWRQKYSWHKARLRLTKWGLWLGIGFATGGAWVFYFTDAPTLLLGLLRGEAHPIAYTTMALLTATTFFFGGFAREQICIYACPWPRIQAAMMDEDTLVVGYRHWRGEPRGKGKIRRKAAQAPHDAVTYAAQDSTGPKYRSTPMPGLRKAPQTQVALPQNHVQALGDCIDCMACVNVCPMGIDIRNGQQLECITCALCIDACDEVMDKIGKPRGLIDYMALTDETRERAGGAPRSVWRHILRPRTLLYSLLWAGIGLGLVVAMVLRSPFDVAVAPLRNPTFVTLSDGTIRNAYDVRVRNKGGDATDFSVAVTGIEGARVVVEGSDTDHIRAGVDAMAIARVFVLAGPHTLAAHRDRSKIDLVVTDDISGLSVATATVFNAKEAQP
ncbi:Ubp3 associated protein Bre5 [Aquimixticola soesokkakensis]|uniref:Ubp3 associated protein Bre5 n=1 Tax=Aquimixticola soesokkakensis TaxID=1519096 RepID=A0A1Y5SW30_9RHOB|nr:4Fe-4S dicluster domain-containing protein [Aquimixticola soesokkakensis]SLN47881.1 Ubp3 associated protein Bre5 [Aquimixticola soesokkakensis]